MSTLNLPLIDIKKGDESDSAANSEDSIVPPRHADILGCFVNLTNSMIGSGILGLPFAFAASGWILGVLFMSMAAFCTVMSLHFLALCSMKVKQPASFYRIAEATIPEWAFLIDVSVASMCFGIASSYLIVIGTLMHEVVKFYGGSSAAASRLLWVTISFCIVAPLSFFKSFDALKYTSFVGLISVLYVSILAVAYAGDTDLTACGDDATDDQSCVGNFSLATFNIDTMKSLGVFFFAYSCQQNIFPVVNEIKNPSIGRINLVIYLSIGSAFVMYLFVAIGGYATYGDSVDTDLLLSYPDTNYTTIARIMISFLVCFSYPLLCAPGRNSMMALWLLNDPKNEDGSVSECPEAVIEYRYKACTGGFLICSYIVGMSVSNLGVILELIGATGATMITFILPGAAYYIMFSKNGEGPQWKLYLAAFFFCFGCFIGPLVLAFIFV